MRCYITLSNLLKGAQATFVLVLLQKVIGLPFKHFAHGIRELHAKADHFSINIPLGELNLE